MQHDPATTVHLGAFEPSTAAAVVAVLRRRGVPAWTTRDTTAPPPEEDETLVLVPGGRRDEAFALLASRMEEVNELAAEASTGPPPQVRTEAPDVHDPSEGDEYASGRPIFLEQVRRLGLGLAVVLVPLLVITLAAPSLPLRWAVPVFVAGLVAVTFWRNRPHHER